MTAARAPLDVYLSGLRAEVEAALERVLARSAAPAVIVDPMRYSVIAPGKRMRPCLTLAAAESVAASCGMPASPWVISMTRQLCPLCSPR